MEILNVIPGSDGYFGLGMFFLGVATLFIVLGVLATFKNELGAGVLATIITIVFGFASYSAFHDVTPEKYEVKITDFNEVYNQGYEILSQRGDIYTIVKSEEN